MTDLTVYHSLNSQLPVGTIIFYWGSGLLSHAIEFLSGNGPSHCQMVYRIDADGTIWVVESTIENGVSGVQVNRLEQSILAYPHGSAVGAALLSPTANARADWSKLEAAVNALIGKVAYDVLGLLKFLEPEGLREGQINDHKMVCSALLAELLTVVGILAGIPYSQVSPEWLIEMGIFALFMPLVGNPKPHNFDILA